MTLYSLLVLELTPGYNNKPSMVMHITARISSFHHAKHFYMCPSMTKWGSLQWNWFWLIGKNMSQGQKFSFLRYSLPKYSSYQTQSWQTLFQWRCEWKEMDHLLFDWPIEIHINYNLWWSKSQFRMISYSAVFSIS